MKPKLIIVLQLLEAAAVSCRAEVQRPGTELLCSTNYLHRSHEPSHAAQCRTADILLHQGSVRIVSFLVTIL